MAELHVWTAWRFTCSECGTRLVVTTSYTQRGKPVLAQRIWEHMEEAHQIVGGMLTAKLTAASTHIFLSPAGPTWTPSG